MDLFSKKLAESMSHLSMSTFQIGDKQVVSRVVRWISNDVFLPIGNKLDQPWLFIDQRLLILDNVARESECYKEQEGYYFHGCRLNIMRCDG